MCNKNKIAIKTLSSFLLMVFLGISTYAEESNKITFDQYQVGKTPPDFGTALTGSGEPISWIVQEDPSAPSRKTLTQTSQDDTDYRFPLCVYKRFSAKDLDVSVQFKTVSGKVDQAAGIVVRFLDKDNYYVVRANALEDNINLYKVVNGKRIQFAGKGVKVSSGIWHKMELKVKGSQFEVLFDDRPLFKAANDAIKDPGEIGFWTKADSVTSFDSLSFRSE